jgi:outer membrane protein
MDKSVSFRQESQRLLQKAEAEMMQPVMDRLNKAIQEVATERNLIFVINTDDNAVPFINPLVGVNITEPLLLKLGLASPITAKP